VGLEFQSAAQRMELRHEKYHASALTAAIHVLLTISAYVNDAHVDDKYKLNCSRDLILVGDRYERKGAETLRNLKSRKPA